MSCLVQAARSGELDLVKTLIEQENVDVNSREVLPNEAKAGYSALHEAAKRGDAKMVEYLLAKGAHVNGVSNECYDDYQRKWSNVRVLERMMILENESGPDAIRETPLCLAVESGHVEVARVLLDNKACLDRFRELNLMCLAVFTKNVELINLLLDHGADINDMFYKFLEEGPTPLIYALLCNLTDVAKFLLDRGAKFKSIRQSEGDDAIFFLLDDAWQKVRGGSQLQRNIHLNSIKLVLEFMVEKEGRQAVKEYLNLDSELYTKGFTTPKLKLCAACLLGSLELVKLFLDHGASPDTLYMSYDHIKYPHHYINYKQSPDAYAIKNLLKQHSTSPKTWKYYGNRK